MSIACMRAVWEHSKSKGNDRLLLLVLADQTADDGVLDFPRSQRWLADRINVSNVETVRRAVRSLELLGELRCTPGDGGGTTRYQLLLPGLSPLVDRSRAPVDSAPPPNGGPPPIGGGAPPPIGGGDGAGHLSTTESNNPLIPKDTAAAPPERVVDGENARAIQDLCDHLAVRIFQFRDGTLLPDVTAKWLTDMRLLVERGPTDAKGVNPQSLVTVRRAIDFVFDELAEPVGPHSFSWAKQVRSPGSLRRHWTQLVVAAREVRGTRVSRGTATIERRQRQAQRDGGGDGAHEPQSLLAGTALDPNPVIETQGAEQ